MTDNSVIVLAVVLIGLAGGIVCAIIGYLQGITGLAREDEVGPAATSATGTNQNINTSSSDDGSGDGTSTSTTTTTNSSAAWLTAQRAASGATGYTGTATSATGNLPSVDPSEYAKLAQEIYGDIQGANNQPAWEDSVELATMTGHYTDSSNATELNQFVGYLPAALDVWYLGNLVTPVPVPATSINSSLWTDPDYKIEVASSPVATTPAQNLPSDITPATDTPATGTTTTGTTTTGTTQSYTINDGLNIYDENGNWVGWTDGWTVYDSYGSVIGYLSDYIH